MEAELEKLEYNLGGVRDMKRLPQAALIIDLKTEAIARRRGRPPRDPDPRPGRLERRPDGRRLPDPRQRRLDALLRAGDLDDRRGGRGIAANAYREAEAKRRAEEEERRQPRGGRAPQREEEERARKEAEEAAAAEAARRAGRSGRPRAGPGPASRPSRRPAGAAAGAARSTATAAAARRPRRRPSRSRRSRPGAAAEPAPTGEGALMAVSAKDVKALRERTGAAMMDCKAALEEAGGDLDEAIELLRVKGQASAAKRSERERPSEGVVASYIHAGGKVGVLVEVQCETDFVARNDDFQEFAREVAIHIAGAPTPPRYVSAEEIPEAEREAERGVFAEKAEKEGKPDERRREDRRGPAEEVGEGDRPARAGAHPHRPLRGQDDRAAARRRSPRRPARTSASPDSPGSRSARSSRG